MARLTITLSDERHQALKEAAVRRHTTIGKIIDESLERFGVKTHEDALVILEQARRSAVETMSGMTDDEIMDWAVSEVRADRRERGARAR